MKSLQEYIIEELDENLFWLLDTWFDRNEEESNEFIELLTKYNVEKKKTVKDVQELIKGTKLEKNLIQFINFVDNDIKQKEQNKDYIYNLKKILDIVSGNKSDENKYKIKNG